MMIVQAPVTSWRQIYSADPKVVVVGSAPIPPQLATLVQWYLCEQIDGERYLLAARGHMDDTQPSALRTLEVPPTNAWVLWAPAPINEHALHMLKMWWTEVGGAEPPIVVGTPADLMETILEQSLRETQKLQQSNQQLMRDLAALRESWTSHVRIPQEIEALINTLKLGRPHLAFSSAVASGDVEVPAASTIASKDATADQSVSQPLPSTARGFLGIDLHIADPGKGDGLLCASLEASDTGNVLAEWRVPFDNLCEGWLPLRLQRALTSTSHSLKLKIWSLAGEMAPRLSTCRTGLLREYGLEQPRTSVQDQDDVSMVAFKVWGGLPGLSYDSAPRSFGQALVPIPDTTITEVSLSREQSATYPVFGYLGSGNVLLRPLKTAASAAVIRLPATPGLTEISCDAVIDDKRCQTRNLGARIVVTAAGIGPDDAEAGRNVLAATDWTALSEPLVPSRMIARLPTVQNRPVDLHLFTRLPEPGIPPHARIVFGRFEAEIHATSTWGMEAALSVSDLPS